MQSVFLALLLAMLPVGAPADVSGRWSGTFEATTDEGTRTQPLLLIFKQDGEKLTGSGGPNDGEQHPFENGKVDGDKVTFQVLLERGSISFDLTLAGDELKGDMKRSREGREQTAKVSLKRLSQK
jgi:hypothetical protein